MKGQFQSNLLWLYIYLYRRMKKQTTHFLNLCFLLLGSGLPQIRRYLMEQAAPTEGGGGGKDAGSLVIAAGAAQREPRAWSCFQEIQEPGQLGASCSRWLLDLRSSALQCIYMRNLGCLIKLD